MSWAVVAVTAALLAAAPAAGSVPHVVRPGETLWSLAVERNLTTRALAAANGLPESARLTAGETIQIPSADEAAAALAAGAGPMAGPARAGGGSYTVAPGDTLSGIAARSGVTTAELAALNGLAPQSPLFAGAQLLVPSVASSVSAGETTVESTGPVPTSEYVSPALVGQIAAEHGVSPSLAAAVAKQESGFSNSVVSSADARGVMQLLPDTWAFVQGTLAGSPLDVASAEANVHAGVLYLGQLLRETGGDEALALAAYYQGLASVRQIGVLAETHQYVANVMALRAEFGG